MDSPCPNHPSRHHMKLIIDIKHRMPKAVGAEQNKKSTVVRNHGKTSFLFLPFHLISQRSGIDLKMVLRSTALVSH